MSKEEQIFQKIKQTDKTKDKLKNTEIEQKKKRYKKLKLERHVER